MKIKAVLFDVDNTLVNFMRMKRHAVEAAVEAMIDAGLPVAKESFVEKVFEVYWKEGIEDQQIFDKILANELGRLDHKILAAGILGYRRAKDAYSSVYPHVHPTLMELVRQGIRLAVVSDAPPLQVWMRLVGLGLAHYFEVVVTFEDTKERKPSPKPFNLAMKKLGVESKETLMIGDWAERDIAGAKALGIKTVFAKYGDEFKTVNSGADYEIMDIADLVSIVSGENRETSRVSSA